jgi:hypothetical protein
LNTKLVAQLKASGKEIKEPVDFVELLKDSIFDTDAIKQTKALVIDVQQYLDEVEFLAKNKDLLEKAREKKEENVVVTEAFSKAPENAADFKTVTFTVKKRVISEVTGEQGESNNQPEKILK